jgi:hypothetical protein
MTVLWLFLSIAFAGSGTLDVLVGGRSAPEATLEQPSEWEHEAEPNLVGALAAGWQDQGPVGTWFRVDGEAWGALPEGDTSMFRLAPQAGIGGSAGAYGGELAGRYDASLYPWESHASSGRAEVMARGTATAGLARPEVSVLGLDRHYFQTPAWSFRTLEPGAGLGLTVGPLRIKLGSSLQLNGGGAGSPVVGQQARAVSELGVAGRSWDLWLGYRLIKAWGGGPDEGARAQFTPVGAYAEDADALSAGGFLQHRVDLGGVVTAGRWTLRAAGLARFRAPDDVGLPSVSRTLHGQLDLERDIGERLSILGTGGVSHAELSTRHGYTDVYGWLGLRWELGPDAD